MKKTILLAFAVIAATLIFNECKKGDTGPAGNANVQNYIFKVTSAQWAADSTNKEWSAELALPTTAKVNGGVFLYAQDGSNWSALPHVDYGVAYSFGYDPSKKTIEVVAADAMAAYMIAKPDSMTFKVVTIPIAN